MTIIEALTHPVRFVKQLVVDLENEETDICS